MVARQALGCPLCLPRLGKILGSLFATLSPRCAPTLLLQERRLLAFLWGSRWKCRG